MQTKGKKDSPVTQGGIKRWPVECEIHQYFGDIEF